MASALADIAAHCRSTAEVRDLFGANAEEAEAGQTKPDFIAKLSISRKEAYEARYWLRLAVASSVAASKELVWELDEITQLIAMLTSAIKTARASQNRGQESQTTQDADRQLNGLRLFAIYHLPLTIAIRH